ncbi:MAG TPA: hypothetical protein VFX48_04600 [Saprospiraceae bacterium]|nr:hypothetical protein [Saprospiraceae bacterium]
MNIKQTIAAFLVLGLLAGCGPTIYLAPDFDKVKSKHRTVAILPFEVNITAKKLPKDVTSEMMRDEEKSTGRSIQNHSYTYFLREMAKDKYTVKFQDIDKTNATLEGAGIQYADLKSRTKEELCTLLDVDAVISGKVTMDKPMSDAGAIAVGFIFGVWTSTNKVDVSMTIHNRKNSELLWKYDWLAEGGVGSSSEELTKNLMRNASKKFPYKKEKK